jgi:hypothetical protein
MEINNATQNSESCIVTCEKCGKEKTYSNKYNARYARVKKACASCSRSRENKNLWKNSEFKTRMTALLKKEREKLWKNPEHRAEMGKVVSQRNKERWANDEEYRFHMLDVIRLNAIAGTYKEHYFRSSLELRYMMKLEEEKISWKNGECREFAIRYEFRGHNKTYYPDFIVGKTVIEIKPAYFWDSDIVKAKCKAAEAWCEKHGYKFKMLDPGAFTAKEMQNFAEMGIIKLSARKLKRLQTHEKAS